MSQDYRLSQGGQLTGIEIEKEKGILSLYPYATGRYEKSDYTGVKACCALSSGTAAIHLALILLGIKENDEVEGVEEEEEVDGEEE